MPAGPEMDALVSAKVLGIVWDETRCRVCGWTLVEEGGMGCWASNCSMRPPPDRRADGPARYSKRIEFAVAILRAAQDYELRSYGAGAAFAGVVLGGSLGEATADGDTDAIPLAICRAALLTTL